MFVYSYRTKKNKCSFKMSVRDDCDDLYEHQIDQKYLIEIFVGKIFNFSNRILKFIIFLYIIQYTLKQEVKKCDAKITVKTENDKKMLTCFTMRSITCK